jgi:bifunctional DNA-binding transcriptional regulator/antitoxin component of YhaV-PrlF toxin-antitoxin module
MKISEIKRKDTYDLISFTAKLDSKCRIVIPKPIRIMHAISRGSRIVLAVEERR